MDRLFSIDGSVDGVDRLVVYRSGTNSEREFGLVRALLPFLEALDSMLAAKKVS